MYPWARTVTIASGWSSAPSGSFSLARSRATCMSTARVSSPAVPIPHTRPSSSSRDTARSRLHTRYLSRAASVSDRSVRVPPGQRTSRRCRSIVPFPTFTSRTSGGFRRVRRSTASTRASSSLAENGLTT
jgi:hypothetical protein